MGDSDSDTDLEGISVTYWTWPSLGIALFENIHNDGYTRIDLDDLGHEFDPDDLDGGLP